MKITKLDHACLDITEGNSRLVVDPGVYSSLFTNFVGIIGLVITHIHPDHLDADKVKAILQQSPAVQIFTTQEVADELANAQVTVPSLGQQYSVGDFTLEFFGGQHAKIMEGYPAPGADHNFGILVNDKLYYPGDSLTPCPKPHSTLAIASMAPWLKMVEAVDFIQQDSASQVFPTHNHFLSEDGEVVTNRILSGAVEAAGKTYTALKPGDSLEV